MAALNSSGIIYSLISLLWKKIECQLQKKILFVMPFYRGGASPKKETQVFGGNTVLGNSYGIIIPK